MIGYNVTSIDSKVSAMITQAELGRRLRLARLNVGLSQEAVAADLAVPRPTISQIEGGKRGVSSIELAKLARVYRRPLASFFDEDFGPAPADDPVAMLVRDGALAADDRSVLGEFASLCRAYRDLEALLGRPGDGAPPDYHGIGEPASREDAVRQGEDVAAEERRRVALGDDAVRDLLALLDGQGVPVAVRALRDGDVSGLFLHDDALGPCILVNGAAPPEAWSFYAAHEYAHILLDRRLVAHASRAGCLLSKEGRGELVEVRANSFAAAFLLPASGVERFLGGRGRTRRDGHTPDVLDAFYLHRAFGLSYQATLFRLESLGWLSRHGRAALARYESAPLARAFGLPDGAELARIDGAGGGYPLRYTYLALEAYRRGKISLGKLGELLGQDLADVRELVWEIGGEPDAPLRQEAV
jgi:Zn-dependent peptidase ImmA (M78 family)/DNA-binding XRE family transcriptional regulator